AARRRRPVREAAFGDLFGHGGPALGGAERRRYAKLGDLEEQIAQLGGIGRVGTEPALEPGLDALEMRQRRCLEVGRSPLGQLALVHDGVEELPSPPDEVEEPVELVEPAAFDIRHVVSVCVPPIAGGGAETGASAARGAQNSGAEVVRGASDGTA